MTVIMEKISFDAINGCLRSRFLLSKSISALIRLLFTF